MLAGAIKTRKVMVKMILHTFSLNFEWIKTANRIQDEAGKKAYLFSCYIA